MLLRFQKPPGFNFQAGQFCFVTAPELGFHDQEGFRKPFSIASSPLEKELVFVLRLTETAFKRTLKEMPLGATVAIDSPVGLFTLPKKTGRPLVFLAGGIGVSPFRSMMKYSVDASTGHKITLLYSSRVPEEAIFLDELRNLVESDSRMAVIATMTRPDRSGHVWSGPTGRVDQAMIKKQCKDWQEALYYVSGPPAMVEDMRNLLLHMGIIQQRTKQEVWAGY